VVERQGLPLTAHQTPANEHDSVALAGLIASIPPVKQPFGYRRKRPGKLHADKGYDFARCRAFLRSRGITPRIARRGIESSEKLGRHRWVAERTLAWLSRFRRLTIRYERRADIHQAFLVLGCALVCFKALTEWFC
jgi:IS5 family transposase